jgi:hypothetical protein
LEPLRATQEVHQIYQLPLHRVVVVEALARLLEKMVALAVVEERQLLLDKLVEQAMRVHIHP